MNRLCSQRTFSVMATLSRSLDVMILRSVRFGQPLDVRGGYQDPNLVAHAPTRAALATPVDARLVRNPGYCKPVSTRVGGKGADTCAVTSMPNALRCSQGGGEEIICL